MTRPLAPNTAHERRMAPTLCGSVTWSRTTSGPAGLGIRRHLGEARLVERLGLDEDALMHRVGPEQAVEIAGANALRR